MITTLSYPSSDRSLPVRQAYPPLPGSGMLLLQSHSGHFCPQIHLVAHSVIICIVHQIVKTETLQNLEKTLFLSSLDLSAGLDRSPDRKYVGFDQNCPNHGKLMRNSSDNVMARLFMHLLYNLDIVTFNGIFLRVLFLSCFVH